MSYLIKFALKVKMGSNKHLKSNCMYIFKRTPPTYPPYLHSTHLPYLATLTTYHTRTLATQQRHLP